MQGVQGLEDSSPESHTRSGQQLGTPEAHCPGETLLRLGHQAVAVQRTPSSRAPLNPKEKPIWVPLHRAFPERGGLTGAALCQPVAQLQSLAGWAATLRVCLRQPRRLMGGRDAHAKPDTHMEKISPTRRRDRPVQDDPWKRLVWYKPKEVHHPSSSWARVWTDKALVSPGDGLRVQNGSRFRPISTSCTPAGC